MNRIFSHVRTDTVHRSGQALPATQKAREQIFVINSIAAQSDQLNAAGGAVSARIIEEILDHDRTLGLYSYLVKDYNPSAAAQQTWDKNPMEKRDPFIEGMRKILAERADLKPAPLSEAAGLDNSTLRKALAGTIQSLTVEKAAKLASAAGYDLSTVIAIGEHSRGAEIVRLALAIQAAGSDVRDEVDGYLQVKLAQGSAKSHPDQLPEASTKP